jgi:hypothetical protein
MLDYDNWENEVVDLYIEGHGIATIALMLGLSRQDVLIQLDKMNAMEAEESFGYEND